MACLASSPDAACAPAPSVHRPSARRVGVCRPICSNLARARLIELAQARVDSMRCNGLRLVAAAGTRLRVATRQGHERCADHDAFALFLPGPELTLHAALHPADGAERQMLFEALDLLQPQTDLLLVDRGYIGNMMDESASRPDRLYAPGALKPVLGACLLRIEHCRDRLADVSCRH